jgi:hypothetical protein
VSMRKFATREGIHESPSDDDKPVCERCGEVDSDERILGKVDTCQMCVPSDAYQVEKLQAELAAARDGKCSGVIPSTFIACGEDGNYCSEACRLRALLLEYADHARDSGWLNLAKEIRMRTSSAKT